MFMFVLGSPRRPGPSPGREAGEDLPPPVLPSQALAGLRQDDHIPPSRQPPGTLRPDSPLFPPPSPAVWLSFPPHPTTPCVPPLTPLPPLPTAALQSSGLWGPELREDPAPLPRLRTHGLRHRPRECAGYTLRGGRQLRRGHAQPQSDGPAAPRYGNDSAASAPFIVTACGSSLYGERARLWICLFPSVTS